MFRFTIRDVLWLTVAVAIGLAWWIEHGRLLAAVADAESRLLAAVTDANIRLDEAESQRVWWERNTQIGAAAHNRTLGVIEKSGLAITGNGNARRLVKIREPDSGFNIEQQQSR